MNLKRFINLPREIRDTIYKMVFECESVQPNSFCTNLRAIFRQKHVSFGNFDGCLHARQYPGQAKRPLKHVFANELLSLLLVSRQISTEAKIGFYEKTVFTGSLFLPNGLYFYLKGSGHDRKNMIRIVELGPCFSH